MVRYAECTLRRSASNPETSAHAYPSNSHRRWPPSRALFAGAGAPTDLLAPALDGEYPAVDGRFRGKMMSAEWRLRRVPLTLAA